ncbi:hypothetical protein JD844_022313 [Phrynosoma platyrhinos]|uniref:Uncharacterized protein n=1 Tax=Phrynosoma platyrhinos TaxID=52577 RepID=A0ABQ7SVX5_PHRPL|nr:hypothetical protein JD844_022313 [Phrynosoma platyrhinos]
MDKIPLVISVKEILSQACQLGDGQLFTSNLKELYVAVTQEQTRATCKRHREASGDSETVEHPRSQDLAQKAVDLPAEEEKTGSQPVTAQSVQDTVVREAQSTPI